jgi:hypothetical protein
MSGKNLSNGFLGVVRLLADIGSVILRLMGLFGGFADIGSVIHPKTATFLVF